MFVSRASPYYCAIAHRMGAGARDLGSVALMFPTRVAALIMLALPTNCDLPDQSYTDMLFLRTLIVMKAPTATD